MPVTLTPIVSPDHKELSGYEIRGGPEHHTYGDPYEVKTIIWERARGKKVQV